LFERRQEVQENEKKAKAIKNAKNRCRGSQWAPPDFRPVSGGGYSNIQSTITTTIPTTTIPTTIPTTITTTIAAAKINTTVIATVATTKSIIIIKTNRKLPWETYPN
jgi:hypothetical protein